MLPDMAEPGSVEAIAKVTTDPHFLSPWVCYLPQSATVVSLQKFLGRIPGAPGEFVDNDKAHAYCRGLAESSPRVKVVTIGRSEEGRNIVLLALADPRRTDRDAGKKLIATSRSHLLFQRAALRRNRIHRGDARAGLSSRRF
jgi:hypothetical protein